jgi:hypothetical protein
MECLVLLYMKMDVSNFSSNKAARIAATRLQEDNYGSKNISRQTNY